LALLLRGYRRKIFKSLKAETTVNVKKDSGEAKMQGVARDLENAALEFDDLDRYENFPGIRKPILQRKQWRVKKANPRRITVRQINSGR